MTDESVTVFSATAVVEQPGLMALYCCCRAASTRRARCRTVGRFRRAASRSSADEACLCSPAKKKASSTAAPSSREQFLSSVYERVAVVFLACAHTKRRKVRLSTPLNIQIVDHIAIFQTLRREA